jgi:hypothetical protein
MAPRSDSSASSEPAAIADADLGGVGEYKTGSGVLPPGRSGCEGRAGLRTPRKARKPFGKGTGGPRLQARPGARRRPWRGVVGPIPPCPIRWGRAHRASEANDAHAAVGPDGVPSAPFLVGSSSLSSPKEGAAVRVSSDVVCSSSTPRNVRSSLRPSSIRSRRSRRSIPQLGLTTGVQLQGPEGAQLQKLREAV